MRVKIGDTWFESEDQFLGVQFTDDEVSMLMEYLPTTPHRSFGVGLEETEGDLVAWLRQGRDV